MNRIFSLLSGISFLAIVVIAVLMAFGVINPINWLKYLVLFCSTFLTFFSLGTFIKRSALSKGGTILVALLLLIPCLVPLLAIYETEIITNFWKLFIGGSIFQIGTAIFVLMGGFIRKGSVHIYQILNILNYALFLILTLILVFNFVEILNRNLLLLFGGVLSVLSLFLVFFKRKVIV